jgi:hypothetical protein
MPKSVPCGASNMQKSAGPSGIGFAKPPQRLFGDGFAKWWRCRAAIRGGGSGLGCWGGYRPVGGSRGARDFGRVLTYADLPKVRAWRAGAQLGSATVCALRGPEPALSVLFCELSTGSEAWAVPASRVRGSGVFAADRQAAAGQHVRLTGVAAEAPIERRAIGFSRACW